MMYDTSPEYSSSITGVNTDTSSRAAVAYLAFTQQYRLRRVIIYKISQSSKMVLQLWTQAAAEQGEQLRQGLA